MRKHLFITAFFTCMFLGLFAQNKDTTAEILTNTKITELYKKGLAPSIIINKIKTSKTNFDVSTDALIRLKDEKVPDEIVNAMIDASTSKDNAVAVADPNDPSSAHESGIYCYSKTGSVQKMTQIDPTVCTQTKMGSGMATSLTYGIAKTKMKASIDGSTSRNQLTDSVPVFYFYFDKTASSLNQTGSFMTSSSPSEFILVKMTSKQSSREFVTGSYNAYQGMSYGVDDKYKVDFDIEKIGPGIYKVKPRETLEPGEYCFMYAGSTSVAGQMNKVFDFGVK